MENEEVGEDLQRLIDVRFDLSALKLRKKELRDIARDILRAEITAEYLRNKNSLNRIKGETTKYKRLVRSRLCKLASIFSETSHLLHKYKDVSEVPIELTETFKSISALFFAPMHFGYGVRRINNFVLWWYSKLASHFRTERRSWSPEKVVGYLLSIDKIIEENSEFCEKLKKLS